MITSLKSVKKVLTDTYKFVSKRVLGTWELPDVSLLPDTTEEVEKEINYTPPLDVDQIEFVLQRYGIHGKFKDYKIGSAVTTFEVEVPVGTRLKVLDSYRDDIARDLCAPSLRILKALKDPSLIGLEVANTDRYMVHFKDLFKEMPENMTLPIPMGEDTYGKAVYEDLSKMPHMLIAGQTGSGKSVFLNTILASLISKKMPSELQLLIVDPKQIEFIAYEDIPHLMEDIATDPASAHELLNRAVDEMERRFGLLKRAKVKKISDYNKKVVGDKLPHIVFVVDEFADLMMMGSQKKETREVESKIIRIAQKARAVGIHMILATQKPLATIVTSLIKANMPVRVSFNVASKVDSRVILDVSGAETLTGMGDMLYSNPNARNEYEKLRRVQAPWLSDENLELLLNQ